VTDRSRPARRSLHPGEQLAQGKRLDEVVVGTRGEPCQPVVQAVAGSQEQDGQIVACAQEAGEDHAVGAGQRDVQDGQVRPERFGHAPQPRAVGLVTDLIPGTDQGSGDGGTDRRLILDE
jgi:hypothetical protein